jgi:hypothetical protein
MPDRRKLLAIYLNDHLAGATAGRELAKRSAGANEGTEFGRFLEGLLGEVVEDRATLVSVMDRLGVRQDPVKRAAAVAAERGGRLKLNGSLRGYSPLSRVVELEGLRVGVDAKRSLWETLGGLDLPELSEFDFAALAARAGDQHGALSAHKQDAARIAMGAAG